MAKQSGNFEEADKQFAFGIWYIEKEFNVGPITEDFLLMKYFNLVDEWNTNQYKRINESDGGTDKPKTIR